MRQPEEQIYSVSDFVNLLNQNFEYSYPEVVVTGEVSSFNISHNKWVFFDIKDAESSLSCFLSVYQLNHPVEDGMIINVRCQPKITKWGKFSLTVRSIELLGEGSIKKSFDMLFAKLEKEGLFLDTKKRPISKYPSRIGLVTSKQAAAYNDFVTIVEQGWSGLTIDHLQVQVQGVDAESQIVSAIEYFNTHYQLYDAIVITRGGGSAEDLQVFNSEPLVRAVSGSKVPTIVAIGHEDDISLAELAADKRATTPTNAAQIIVPDKNDQLQKIDSMLKHNLTILEKNISNVQARIEKFSSVFRPIYTQANQRLSTTTHKLMVSIDSALERFKNKSILQQQALTLLDPSLVLKRGYSIIRQQDKVIRLVEQIDSDVLLDIEFYNGKVRAKVIDKIINKEKK